MFIFGFIFSPNKRILERLRDDQKRGSRIRCPKCQWEPKPHDTWCCAPGCGHVWNTFQTRGTCPGCNKQWTDTACLRCGAWSRHEDWYEETDED